MREVELLEENAQLHRSCTEELRKRIRELENENERLRDALRDANTLNVAAYVAGGELSVMAVTNGSAEGGQIYERILRKASANQSSLAERGVLFGVVDEIPVNHIHSTPFLRDRH